MPVKKNIAPEGASVVSPYLILKDVAEEIEFFRQVFNAQTADVVKSPDGTIMHAEIRIGGSAIMLGAASEKFPPNQSTVYVYVEDADAVYNKALQYGATSLMEPEDRFYGNREGGVMDKQGNTWWIAKYLRTVSREEIEKAMSEMIAGR